MGYSYLYKERRNEKGELIWENDHVNDYGISYITKNNLWSTEQNFEFTLSVINVFQRTVMNAAAEFKIEIPHRYVVNPQNGLSTVAVTLVAFVFSLTSVGCATWIYFKKKKKYNRGANKGENKPLNIKSRNYKTEA